MGLRYKTSPFPIRAPLTSLGWDCERNWHIGPAVSKFAIHWVKQNTQILKGNRPVTTRQVTVCVWLGTHPAGAKQSHFLPSRASSPNSAEKARAERGSEQSMAVPGAQRGCVGGREGAGFWRQCRVSWALKDRRVERSFKKVPGVGR